MEELTKMGLFSDIDLDAELPGLDDMLIVEDNFLDQYISDLTPSDFAMSNMTEPKYEATYSPKEAEGDFLQQLDAELAQPVPANNVQIPYHVVTTGVAAPAQQQQQPPLGAVNGEYQHPPLGLHTFDSVNLHAQQQQQTLADIQPRYPSSNSLRHSNSSGEQQSNMQGGSPVGNDNNGSAKGRRRRVRNQQQQVQNKLAQQRYREKRKSRFSNLEKAVEELTQQVGVMHEVESEKLILQGEKESLDRVVEQQRGLIADLQEQVRQLRLQANGEEGGEPSSSVNSGCGYEDGGEAPPGEDVRAMPSPEMYVTLMKQKIDILRNLIEVYRLDPGVDPEGRSVLPKDVAVLQGTIRDVCKLSFCATNEHTLKRVDKKCCLDEAKAVTCPIAKQHFKLVLDRVHLTPRQLAELESIREACLGKLRSMYDEREKLNMELVALMLPVRNVGGTMVDQGGAAQYDRVVKTSIIPCLHSNLDSFKKMEDIRRSIQKELRIHNCANFRFVTKVLTPVQAAVSLVAMYPVHLDALGMATYVHMRTLGNEDDFCVA